MTNGGYPTQALIRFNVSFASTNRPSATSIGWRSCLATFGPSQSARSRRIPILRLALPMRALTALWFACMINETSWRGFGTALFSGMIAASFLGIFLPTTGRGETRSLTDSTEGDFDVRDMPS